MALAAAQQVELVPECLADPVSGFDFLRACCQGAASDRIVSSGLGSDLAWRQVLSLASHHRVLPALHAVLQGRADVPAGVRSALSERFSAHSRRVLRFSAALSAILRQFAASGIEVILHKGPALAQRLYGDPAMREFGDLDLLVRARDVHRARASLQELGLEPHLQLSQRQERAYLRNGYEYVFGSAAEPNLVELQWQIAPRFYAFAFRPEELFQRSAAIEFEGQPARTFGSEDLLLTLCVHAAKHCWPQLGMVRDIAAAARGPLDWHWMIAEAKRLGILRILTVSLALGRNLLGAALPREAATGAALGECEAIAAIAERRMRSNLEPDTESVNYFRMMMRLREKRRHRAQFAARLALTPSVSEWNAIRLPDGMFPLYYGVRVLRLLRRAF